MLVGPAPELTSFRVNETINVRAANFLHPMMSAIQRTGVFICRRLARTSLDNCPWPNSSAVQDSIAGTAEADTINAGPGDDLVNGFGGDDTINGGPGRDSLQGGVGDDFVQGGSGHDTINVRGEGTDRVECGSGTDVVNAGPDDLVAKNCEQVNRAQPPSMTQTPTPLPSPLPMTQTPTPLPSPPPTTQTPTLI